MAWKIEQWTELYDNAEARKVQGPLPWVRFPTNFAGRDFRQLGNTPDGRQAFAAFVLMVEVAAAQVKIHRSGVLAKNGKPYTADHLSNITGWPADVFESAFPVLAAAGWISDTTLTAPEQHPDIVRIPPERHPNVTRTPPEYPPNATRTVPEQPPKMPLTIPEDAPNDPRTTPGQWPIEPPNATRTPPERYPDGGRLSLRREERRGEEKRERGKTPKFVPDVERFTSEFPGPVNDLAAQYFCQIVQTQEIQNQLFEKLAAWNESEQWQRGIVKGAVKWLNEGDWKIAPKGPAKPQGTRFLPLEGE